MKNLLTVIKISLFLPLLAWAKPVATVLEVQGNAFAVSEGKTIPLRSGSMIEGDSHLITEIGAKVSFVDFYDRQFEFAGGGHARILENQVELNRGYLWVESFQNRQSLQLRSANSKVNLSRGEVVFSFDSSTGRSQLMCVEGSVTLSNKIDPDFYATLATGEFSFIDPEINEGLPRGATKIGYKSFEKMAMLFDKTNEKRSRNGFIANSNNIKNMKNEMRPIEAAPINRMPASDNAFSQSVKYLKTEFKGTESSSNESPSGFNSRNRLLNMYEDKRPVKESAKKVVKKKSRAKTVKVRTFGVGNFEAKSQTKSKTVYKRPSSGSSGLTIGEMLKQRQKRAPASQPASFYKKSYDGSGKNKKFIDSLQKHYKKQQKHPNEVNSLIRELKNYQEDYTPNY